MIKAKVPHLDTRTRAKTYKAIQNVFLTMMQVLGIITMSVGLWIFLRLKLSVNCHFLDGFLTAGIFLTLSGLLSIVISTIVIGMILRGKVTVRFCHYVLGFAFVLALECVSCVYATIDHYVLYNLEFQELVQQDFAEFFSNQHKPLDCWASLQKKFACCGEKDPLDWLLVANRSTSSSLILNGLESCKCDKKKRKNAQCTEISASQVPFNLSLTSLQVFSTPCYKAMYSFIDYQCKLIRIFGSCLMIFQLVNFLAAMGLIKKFMSEMLSRQCTWSILITFNIPLQQISKYLKQNQLKTNFWYKIHLYLHISNFHSRNFESFFMLVSSHLY